MYFALTNHIQLSSITYCRPVSLVSNKIHSNISREITSWQLSRFAFRCLQFSLFALFAFIDIYKAWSVRDSFDNRTIPRIMCSTRFTAGKYLLNRRRPEKINFGGKEDRSKEDGERVESGARGGEEEKKCNDSFDFMLNVKYMWHTHCQGSIVYTHTPHMTSVTLYGHLSGDPQTLCVHTLCTRNSVVTLTRLLKTGELGDWTAFGAFGGTFDAIFVCSSSFSTSPSSTSFCRSTAASSFRSIWT